MFALILYPIEELGYIKHVLRNFDSFKSRTGIENSNFASITVFKDVIKIHTNVIKLVCFTKIFKILMLQILAMWAPLMTL